ncbi:hypothetical protein BM86_20460 [Bacillus thuringiensis]|uniref:IS6 family transposase n=1 Tax=Bacillus thuringiensis TaxID=1428 RepID=A0A9W3SIR9_BACTU|nr:IS6 family transposase [Bacillus thuringiensis]ANS51625.1 hypothetical protein BT246_63340 [Bacillus thuringiensis]MBH0337790.1 hypothetical protein [Bacillus thuringiensis]
MEKENIFKWKHYQPDIIVLTVRWYLRYNLSLRDLVEMMEERGLSLAHTTIMRWVHQYGPELNERIRNMLGLESFPTAIKMIICIEAMHMIKKGQTLQGEKSVQKQIYLINELFGLTA